MGFETFQTREMVCGRAIWKHLAFCSKPFCWLQEQHHREAYKKPRGWKRYQSQVSGIEIVQRSSR